MLLRLLAKPDDGQVCRADDDRRPVLAAENVSAGAEQLAVVALRVAQLRLCRQIDQVHRRPLAKNDAPIGEHPDLVRRDVLTVVEEREIGLQLVIAVLVFPKMQRDRPPVVGLGDDRFAAVGSTHDLLIAGEGPGRSVARLIDIQSIDRALMIPFPADQHELVRIVDTANDSVQRAELRIGLRGEIGHRRLGRVVGGAKSVTVACLSVRG